MIAVNYQTLDDLLRVSGWSRRKLALSISVNPGSFAGSFRRHSRMKIDTVWKIADALSVYPTAFVDRDGYGSEDAYLADLKAVENGRPAYERLKEDARIDGLCSELRQLNGDGIQKALEYVLLLKKIPEFNQQGGTKSDKLQSESMCL